MSRSRWLFAAAVVVQLVVLYAPRSPSGGGVPGIDKVVHVAVFALVTWVGLRSGAPRALVVLLTVVHAPVSELLQAVALPGRSGDAWDVVADLGGCVVGWWAASRGRMRG